MAFWRWLNLIAAETVATGPGFRPSWRYVAVTLLLPMVIGLVLAGVLALVDRLCGSRLSGGSI